MPAPVRLFAAPLLALLAAALVPGPPLGPVVEVASPRWLWPALSSGLGVRRPNSMWRLPGHRSRGDADETEAEDEDGERWRGPGELDERVDEPDRVDEEPELASPLERDVDERWP